MVTATTAAGVCLRAVRGATTVRADEPSSVLDAVEEMLTALLRENGLTASDIVSAFFTATADLRSVFPAEAARRMGWHDVPLMCAAELPVAGALARCIRVMLHVAVEPGATLRAVYLHDARVLRPDLAT